VPVLNLEYNGGWIHGTSTDDKVLLIISDSQSLAYAVMQNQNSCLFLREYSQAEGENFSDFHANVMAQDEFLQASYNKVRLGIANKRISLVPTQIFEENRARFYLENVVPVWSSDYIMTDQLKNQPIFLVYAYRKSALASYIQSLKEPVVSHAFSCYLNQLSYWGRDLVSGNHIFVNAMKQSLFIAYFRNDELVYANIYDFKTAEDFLYYILLIYNEFKLAPEEVPIHITGKLEAGSKLYNIIFRYIKNIDFFENENVLFPVIPDFSPHMYFDLFSLYSCE